jgi:cyclopropane-fatty-acyl-phospholipid synthase
MSEARGTTAHARIRIPRLGLALLRRLLQRLEHGRLVIVLPDGTMITHRGAQPGPEAWLELRNWRPLRALLLHGDTGFAESYIAGDWISPDLASFLRFGAENMAGVASGPWATRFAARLRHWTNRNSRQGSRRNIMAHYDLGNKFYARWLDASMTYSAALYANADEDLATAQMRKLERVTALLQVEPGTKVLEIGCGWGALVERLIRAGAHVTGLTLSPAQAEYARGRLVGASLAEHAEIALRDYRDETGAYDRIVSIEMLEAVGVAYWPAYFAALRARLKQGGRAVLQVITIAEERFDAYRRNPDFVQSHVFPGGMLPTKSAIGAQAAAAGLVLKETEFFGKSYELTLVEWRRRFLQSWSETQSEDGFAPSFRQLWDYYLAYCIAGFATGMTDVGFYVLEPAP